MYDRGFATYEKQIHELYIYSFFYGLQLFLNLITELLNDLTELLLYFMYCVKILDKAEIH